MKNALILTAAGLILAASIFLGMRQRLNEHGCSIATLNEMYCPK